MQIKNIIFAGTPLVSAKLLQDLLTANIPITACYTQPDKPQGRGKKLGFSPVKQLCLENNINILQPNTLKDPLELTTLQSLNPDLMIVFAYGLILPTRILSTPKLGCINIHTSLLPRWRGAAPTQRALLAGDQQTGITIMQMDAGLDTGAILHSIPCSISSQDTNQSLLEKLQPLATKAILNVLHQLENNNINLIKQDDSLACYANKIHKAEAQIKWQLSAIEIDRQIRAFIPEPVAYTSLITEETTINNIKVWQARPQKTPILDTNIAPGSILNINNNYLEIATGNGSLQITELQFPGKTRQNINNLLNSPKYKSLFNSATFN